VIYTERICNLVAEEKFIALPSVDGKAYPVGNATGRITVSAGIAQYNPNQDRSDLVSDVDKALYAAKLNGRNQVVVSGEPVVDKSLPSMDRKVYPLDKSLPSMDRKDYPLDKGGVEKCHV
jgi:hypothetical protein